MSDSAFSCCLNVVILCTRDSDRYSCQFLTLRHNIKNSVDVLPEKNKHVVSFAIITEMIELVHCTTIFYLDFLLCERYIYFDVKTSTVYDNQYRYRGKRYLKSFNDVNVVTLFLFLLYFFLYDETNTELKKKFT